MFGKNKHKPLPRREASPARVSPEVFSYHSMRSAQERSTGRVEQLHVTAPRRKLDVRYLPTWLAVLAIAVSVLYALGLSSNAKVTVASTEGSLTRAATVYQATAKDILARTFLSYSKLTIDTETTAHLLQQQFPEIERVAVNIPLLGRRPHIVIQTARPALLLVSPQNGAYYVDGDGRVLVKAATTGSLSVKPPTVQDESGMQLTPNTQVVPKQTVDFITTVLYQLSVKNIAVETLVLPLSPYEFRVKPVGVPYTIRFNLQADAREQVGAYLAVVERLKGQKVVPAAYIDVRVEDRAYYK